MTDSGRDLNFNRRVLRHSGWYLLAIGIQRGLGLVLLPVATRVLSEDDLGTAGLLLALSAVLSVVLSFGLNVAVVRLFHDEPSGSRRGKGKKWAGVAVTQVGVSVVVGVLLVVTLPTWADLVSPRIGISDLRVAIAYAVSMSAFAMALSIVRTSQRSGLFLGISLLHVAIAIPSAILGLQRSGVVGYLLALTIATTIAAIVGFATVLVRPAWSYSTMKAASRLGVPFMLHQGSSWILTGADRVIIERDLGLTAVGAYYAPYSLGSIPALLADAFNSAWAPALFASSDQEEDTRAGEWTANGLIVLVSGVVLVGSWVSPLVIRLIYPAATQVSIVLLVVIAISSVSRVPYVLGVAMLMQRHRVGALTLATTSSAILNIGLNVVLIPVIGLVGAAIATAISYSLQALVVSRSSSGDLSGWWNAQISMLLVAAVSLPASIFLNSTLPVRLAVAGAAGIVGAAVVKRGFNLLIRPTSVL